MKPNNVTRLLDKRAKIDDFEKQLTALIAHEEKAVKLIEELERTTSTAYLEELRVALTHMGVHNMIVDTKITRGFDYYFGVNVPNHPPYCFIENDRTVGQGGAHRRKTAPAPSKLQWVSRPMRALVDLSDTEAVYGVLDRRDG